MDSKTFRKLWQEEEVELVERHADPSWRHGCYMNEVYRHTETGALYSVSYQLSGDGEYNGISEGHCSITEVEEYEETTVVKRYRPITAGPIA